MHASCPIDARALRRMLSVAGILTICTSVSAYAQSHDGPGKYGALTGDLLFSNDSDHFNEERANLGYLFSTGWGLGASVTHYDAPDWSESGRGLYGQYRQHDAQQTLDARLGVMDTGNRTTVTGMLDYMRHVTKDTALGVSAERDVVDSIRQYGSHSMSRRSENVPESPSSALQTMYFCRAFAWRTVRHLMPAGNASPPRPRRPDSMSASQAASPSSASAFFSPVRPSCAR